MSMTHLADCTACGRKITLIPGLDRRQGMTRQEAKFLFISAEGECRDCQLRHAAEERDRICARAKEEARAAFATRVISTLTFEEYRSQFYKSWVNRPAPEMVS